ncbi:MAG TPA: hypothetical protein VKR06_33520 [Ktedonosporobacter sp.]|nr:hypothetical protein [Ktedonosporobacter sp.]
MVIARQILRLSGSRHNGSRMVVAQGIFVPIFGCVRLPSRRSIVS